MTNDDYDVMLTDALMKRVTALEAGQAHMMDKLNRAEANAAHAKPVVDAIDPVGTAIDNALASLTVAIDQIEAQVYKSNSFRQSVLERFTEVFTGKFIGKAGQ